MVWERSDFRRIELVTSLNELVGYKAGVALNREQMQTHVGPEAGGVLIGDNDDMLRVRAEFFDELLCKLLYAVGNIRTPSSMPSRFELYHRVRKDEQPFPIYIKLMAAMPRFIEKGVSDAVAARRNSIDPKPFVDWARQDCGMVG